MIPVLGKDIMHARLTLQVIYFLYSLYYDYSLINEKDEED